MVYSSATVADSMQHCNIPTYTRQHCGRQLLPATMLPSAVIGDMGSYTLQRHTDGATLKWWYKLTTFPEDTYSNQSFNQKWNIKPHRGRQEKCTLGWWIIFFFNL